MLVDTLLASAERGAGRPAMADPFVSLDYGNLVRFADVMRRQVEKATSHPHVGILMPAGCAFAGTFYGALWAGRTAVPLNFLLQPAEVAAVVKDSGLDTVFTVKYFAEMAAALPCKVVYMEDLPVKREMVMERLRRTPPAPSVGPDDTAVLLYTSGTSGVPKGVCQTYRNLRSDIDGAIRKAQLKTDHHFLGMLPLFHSFGLTAMLLVPVSLGSSVYYLPRFNPTQVIDTIREQQSSVTMMIASMYSALLRVKKGGAEDLKSIQYAISGGEGLPDSVHGAFRERFGVDVLQGYGMTEASPVVSLNVPWSNRVGTVGQAIPDVEVAAFDDQGRRLGADEIGELRVRGPIVMKGYYKKEEETRAAITPDGWYLTGDMGKVDAEGYISITGRKKEMIIVGGENVYPREIEAVLEQHAAVAEVAVVGQRDESRGEVVVAFVTLREGAAATEMELREFCRDKIAGYKVPRKVIISQDLPRGPTGKILKRKLAEFITS
ncbi:MAG: long-chain-fatty-acid--CoA ligase [Planctomycetota bacterium]|nr:MAG: long-chain-fatty-acid--CoA ligase [Planctomycetota bacterium]